MKTPISYKPRNAAGSIQAVFALGIFLSPAFLWFHAEKQSRQITFNDFLSSRDSIQRTIDIATEKRDLNTLIELEKKYSGVPTDQEFQSKLRVAVATVTEEQIQIELAVSKRLDQERHMEEVSIRPDPLRPQLSKGDESYQKLSILPR